MEGSPSTSVDGGVSVNGLIRADRSDDRWAALQAYQHSSGDIVDFGVFTESGGYSSLFNIQNSGLITSASDIHVGSRAKIISENASGKSAIRADYLIVDSSIYDDDDDTVNISENLDVNGSIAAHSVCIDGDCIGTWSDLGSLGSSPDTSWTQSGNNLYSAVSGNVGIGTSSPSEKLGISGNLAIEGKVYGPVDSEFVIQARSEQPLVFNTDGNSEKMRITNSGNVRIGTSETNARLSVEHSQNWAVWAQSSSTIDGGVFGYATSTAQQNSTGVWGVTNAKGNLLGQPIGVRGDATNDDPVQGQFGVLGYNHATRQDDGLISAGVWGGSVGEPGDEGPFEGHGSGIVGESYSNYNTSGGGVFYALSETGQAEGVAAATRSSNPNSYAVYGSGKIGSSGLRVSVVNTPGQGPTEIYSMEATEPWVSDFGFGSTVGGRARIQLDPTFLETIDIGGGRAFHVFIQPYGDARLSVSRDDRSFEVLSIDDRYQSVEFSYRVVAKRRHHRDERLRPVAVEIDRHMEPRTNRTELRTMNETWNLVTPVLDHNLPNLNLPISIKPSR